MGQQKTNLFLVGAMKAGTTSLTKVFGDHGDVYVSPIKEPHYFASSLPKELYEPSRFFSLDDYIEHQFPKPLHIAHVTSREVYDKLYSLHQNETWLLDASTMYLQAPGAAKKIHDYNPEASIIIVKRDPLKRAFSQYRMLVGLSKENRSFQEVMNTEITQYENGTLPWYSYLGMSFYNKSITTYQHYFNRVLILNFETIISDEGALFKTIEDFLNISFSEKTSMAETNKTRSPKFRKVFYFLKRIGFKDVFSRVVPKRFKSKIYHTLSTDKKERMELTNETIVKLKAIFEVES